MGRTQAVGAVILVLALAGCSSANRSIIVGSKNFTEQVILGEIVAQHIENRLHKTVERRLNLGGTLLAHQALTSGQIDLYPEYTGTALTAILKDRLQDQNAAAVLERVRVRYRRDFHIEWLDPLGIDNSFAMVIRGPDARRLGLNTLTDAARATEAWALGAGYEFEQRPDGLAALDRTYHLRWKDSPKSMDLGLLYRALEQQQVSMIAANATDGLLSAMDLKVLVDDKRAFPPYQICIAVRENSLSNTPGLRECLIGLSGKFSNEIMQKLNYQVDALHRPVPEVASEFLKQAGLK